MYMYVHVRIQHHSYRHTVEPLNEDAPELWTPLKYGHLSNMDTRFCPIVAIV